MKNNQRHDANIELVNHLILLISEYPDLRFGQILEHFGFVHINNDRYDSDWLRETGIESIQVLRRVTKAVQKMDNIKKV